MPDNEDTAGTVPAAAPKNTKKMILAGAAAFALVAAGILAGSFLRNAPQTTADGEGPATSVLARSDEPALYASLHPPLVVNFTDARGKSHFMQINMEVMARDQKVIDAVRTHAPVIRNSLILLYGNTDYEAAVTREGKEWMLAAALEEIQGVLRERIGNDGVEAVYFTNLIIQ